MKGTIQALRPIIKGIPLFGGLADCSLRDHWESLGQLVIILALSTTPLWLGSLIVFASGPSLSWNNYFAAFRATVQNGELFMYATALLAPVSWMALVDPPGARVFPSKISHMFLIGVINLIAAAFFGLSMAHHHLNPDFLSRASWVIFSVSVLLLYLGTVYHTSRLPDIQGEFKREENAFSAAYGEHKK